MNADEYFDEEYSSFQNSVLNTSAILFHSQDLIKEMLEIQKNNLNISQIKSFKTSDSKDVLDNISRLSSLLSSLLTNLENIKSSIADPYKGNNV